VTFEGNRTSYVTRARRETSCFSVPIVPKERRIAMNIKFNEKAKLALKELVSSKENGVIRLKVLAFG